ncbi:Spindle pole body protein ppc89 [Fulvia fulva]|uniref:Spindle pole body protein ppc89 n=1 Tax=Passalora fulva TaxID=5499 RepID=A0A9Q8L664_PASFU|nr:Spindle pole body protein ppc89 [Fulvia fulva]KAK4636331.1 Spindle pole body protein ppc89 [Fulvia fulva]KAK4636601.1 Spindle pole body protein ppc89 [Fulvia fulva]UJO11575.1 Spindle pole body protein ppc89 [Fulvia fulva]WPV08987.1 Spindle pole body protein ppc89 [Fulvia fulva]WPV23847.1 Spindle pole body protein ppc89 [Fulvia fulva]
MAASRSRFANANRASSPNDDVYQTATQTSFQDVIQSTPQQQDFSLQDDAFPRPYDQQSGDSSTDMLIEMGRGTKRAQDYDMSSNAIFSFGNDNSQYEVTGTPPVRPNHALRKQASVRSAKQRAVSEKMPTRREDAARENTQRSGTLRVRSSRFTAAQHVSAAYTAVPTRYTAEGGLQMGDQPTPRRTASAAAHIESAAYTTSQSFMLPDMADMTAMIAGGTPVFRKPAASRSRFTFNAPKQPAQLHHPIDGAAIPNDEKYIFASIGLLQEKVASLESENSEARKRAEEYEAEILELRSQLQAARRRPGSALGSEDDSIQHGGSHTDIARLEARIKALQAQVDKAERKTSIAEITKSRVTKERDVIMAQITTAYVNNEELASENDALRESQEEFQNEVDELKNQVVSLASENNDLRAKLGAHKTSRANESARSIRDNQAGSGDDGPMRTEESRRDSLSASRAVKHSRESSTGIAQNKQDPTTAEQRGTAASNQDDSFVRDIATAIARETQKIRQQASIKLQDPREARSESRGPRGLHSRSLSRTRRDTAPETHHSSKRHVSAPAGMEVDDAVTATEVDLTRKSRRSSFGRAADGGVSTEEDLTILSDLDDDAMAALRRKLEEERRTGRLHKKPLYQSLKDNDTTRSLTRQSMPRKSSLKDLTGRAERLTLGDGTVDDFLRAAKTVRVQSPHSSFNDVQAGQQDTDVGDESILSNTSRRRRRSSGAEGMTSAFIIPDITMNVNQPLLATLSKPSCINHDAINCTVCPDSAKTSTIPQPIPVTDRDIDVTDATLRPAQAPADALAMVIKNLSDEVAHLRVQREVHSQQYNQHDPAISKRRRHSLKAKIEALTSQIETRSDQIYALYDVLEGQKQAGQLKTETKSVEMTQQDVEDTLTSIGLDPAELSGHVGRKAPAGFDGIDDVSDESELPWEGLSDVESEIGQGR